jgi:hypothetical protein
MMMHDVKMTQKRKEQTILIMGIFPGCYTYGDFVRVKHVASMCQVNPNKASRRKPNKCFHIIKNNA